MQSHQDSDFLANENRWMESLKKKANQLHAEGKSSITGGLPSGEEVLHEWKARGITVRQLPDDEHGILRISIGGGETPVGVNYLVFRGKHSQCVDLLRKALIALQEGPRNS